MNGWEQVVIASETVEAVVLPGLGARLHRLSAFGHEVLLSPASVETHLSEPFQWGGYVLAPWCNRTMPDTTSVAGRSVTLPANFPDGTAIHGQVYAASWQRIGDASFAIEAGGGGWPWRYRVEAGFEAAGSSLIASLRLTNIDDGPMPAGLGLHPWFAGDVEVVIRAARAIASNKRQHAPVEPVEGDLELRHQRPLAAGLDAAWTDLGQPPVELHWPRRGLSATLRAPGASWIVAADAAKRGAIAVEPQTHAPFGLRRLLDGEPGGLSLLAPGSSLELEMRLEFALAP